MRITYANYQFWIFAIGGGLFALAYGRVLPVATPGVESYALALEVDPDYAIGHYNLGVEAQAAGQLEAAHAHYRAARAADPNDHTPCFNDAMAARTLGKLADAIEAARCALVHDGDDPAAVDMLGNLLVARRDFQEAVPVLERALRMRPEHVMTRIDLGAAYGGVSRLEEAEQTLRIAVALRPDLAPAWFNLGLVVWKRGKLDEAYRSFEAAVAADPMLITAMGNLAYLDVEARRPARASAWLDRILAIDPHDQRALKLRAELAASP